VAVGAVVVHDGRVLLVQRGRPPAARQWAVPGGSVRLGESLAAAAEREVLEETGIRIRAGSPLLVFDAIVRDGAGRVEYHYVIVDLEGRYLGGEPRAGDDAADARWVSPGELDDLDVNRATRRLLSGVEPFAGRGGAS
jgi:ADP-ribose pyrophosphatase